MGHHVPKAKAVGVLWLNASATAMQGHIEGVSMMMKKVPGSNSGCSAVKSGDLRRHDSKP